MSSRRLDDRLRELCAKVTRTPDAEVEPLIRELQAVLHDKIERLRTLTTAHLVASEVLKAERRTVSRPPGFRKGRPRDDG